MKKILIVLLLLSGTKAFSQAELFITAKQEEVGLLMPDERKIAGTRHVFAERIYSTFIDTNGFATVQLRGVSKDGKTWKNTGHIVYYDTRQKLVKWTKKTDYRKVSYRQYGSQVFENTAQQQFYVNMETGERGKELGGKMFVTTKDHRLGVATGSYNIVKGIDLVNRKEIWQSVVEKDYGWSSVRWLNDSVLFIVGDGLYAINVHTGKRWNYLATTWDKDYSSAIAMGAAGVALGILTGTYVVPTGADVITSICSTPLSDSGSVYFASKDKIVRLDELTGKIKWTNELPEKMGSASGVVVNGPFLYMVNTGYALMGGRKVKYGVPFIAKYNIETGDEVYLKKLDPAKWILDYTISNERMTLLFDDHVTNYVLDNGEQLATTSIQKLKYGNVSECIGSHVYGRWDDSTYRSLVFSDSLKTYIYTTMGTVIEMDEALKITNEWKAKSLGAAYEIWNEYDLLTIDGKTVVIDKTNNKVAELSTNGSAVLVGNTLFDAQEKSIVEINLAETDLKD